MSDSRAKHSDSSLLSSLKRFFSSHAKPKLPGANISLDPWLATFKQHLQLYLQARYLEIQPSFFTELFADGHKQAHFRQLIFAEVSQSSLQEILLNPHLTILWSSPPGRLAIQATYFNIINPLEGFNPSILKKPPSNPECNALLLQLLKNFSRISLRLAKANTDLVLLPILQDAHFQLALLANQTVDFTTVVNIADIYQAMQTSVDLYLLKHPRLVKKVLTRGAANDATTANQIIKNTVQFP